MNFIVKMLSGEGERNPSSKRVITFLAFLLLALAFISELIMDLKVSAQTFEAMTYIVLGGLGFTASEKFSSRSQKNSDSDEK